MKGFQNIEKDLKSKEREDWLELAEKKWKEDKEEHKWDRDETEKFPTNNPNLAPPEFKEMYQQELKKKYVKTPHIIAARNRVNEIFHFIPGKTMFSGLQ